jgi:transcriptional regulator EpsA
MSYAATVSEHSEGLLRIIEKAPHVNRRSQYFVWSQGDLQRWLPHKLMLCSAYDREHRDLLFDIFNSVPISDIVIRSLVARRSNLTWSAIDAWKRNRMQPCRIDVRVAAQRDEAWTALVDAGYTDLLVHGTCRPHRPDEVETFFLFGQPDAVYSDAAVQSLEMLLSCLHMTYQRVAVTERQLMSAMPSMVSSISPNGVLFQASKSITTREREILQWVRDGLSNQQISEKLGISALTVKNHVQKILRKLGAANRAQAVAKAMTMNVFESPVL